MGNGLRLNGPLPTFPVTNETFSSGQLVLGGTLDSLIELEARALLLLLEARGRLVLLETRGRLLLVEARGWLLLLEVRGWLVLLEELMGVSQEMAGGSDWMVCNKYGTLCTSIDAGFGVKHFRMSI